jgi:hypothetical protein
MCVEGGDVVSRWGLEVFWIGCPSWAPAPGRRNVFGVQSSPNVWPRSRPRWSYRFVPHPTYTGEVNEILLLQNRDLLQTPMPEDLTSKVVVRTARIKGKKFMTSSHLTTHLLPLRQPRPPQLPQRPLQLRPKLPLHSRVNKLVHPHDLLSRLVKVKRPHILVHILPHKGVSASFQPQHHLATPNILDTILQLELEVGEQRKQALELLRVLGVVCGRDVQA